MSDIFSSITNGTITASTYFICTAVTIVCGLLVALVSSFRTKISKGFFTSLIFLPAIVETVVIMVNGNIGTGVAVMGAFSLIRFRSAPGRAKEIVSVFLAMTAGLACAAGYIGVAVIFTLIVCAGIIVTTLIPFHDRKEYDLRVTIPESLNYSDVFDDIFARHTKSCKLVSVKTSNMGSMYKLTYKVELKDSRKSKEFIDELRCRNGNLEIMLSEAEERSDEL